MVTILEYRVDPEVVLNVEGLETPINARFNPNYFTVNSDGKKPLFPGSWVSGPKDDSGPLPRTYCQTEVQNGVTTIIDVTVSNIFVVGQVLAVPIPMARLALTGSFSASDTITLTLDGVDHVFTVSDTLLADIATQMAEAFNDAPGISFRAEFIASGDNVYVISAFVQSVVIATSGGGGVSIGDSLTVLTPFQTVGTIESIDVDNNQITIDSASAIDVGVGVPIGAPGVPLGITPRGFDPVDDELEFALAVKGAFYSERMTYDDPELKILFPGIIRG